ncbi:MAG: helix-turn-helix domain-containing protein [Myxococcota bacterium]
MSGDGSRASIGEYLAQQRKLRGISVDELCEITKIPRRNIERLESGALDGSPDGFARGFVRAIAEALGLDSDEAVMRLMQEPEAEDAPEPRVLTVQQVRWVGVALATLVVLLLWKAVGAWWASRPEPEPEALLQKRHDAVGELVREQSGAPPPAAEDAARE